MEAAGEQSSAVTSAEQDVRIWSESELLTYLQRCVLVDTCVLVDLMLTTRSRHGTVRSLYQYLSTSGLTILVPAHALFEAKSALMNEKITHDNMLSFNSDLTWRQPLLIRFIAIDGTFLDLYLGEQLPYLKGGDMIFLAIANRHRVPLITADNAILQKGRELGITVYTPAEYLTQVGVVAGDAPGNQTQAPGQTDR